MSVETNTPTVDSISAAIKEFEKTQLQYRAYGANDTEPDGIFQRILLDALDGSEPKIPRSGNGWELYASSMDCEDAAMALHNHALAVVKLIENCRIKDSDHVRRMIQDYCWRFQ